VLPHVDAAYGLARWLVRDATAAEEVVQEAVVRALTYFASFRGVSARSWLLQIVRNVAYEAVKRDRRGRLVPIETSGDWEDLPSLELLSEDDDPETRLRRKRNRDRAQQLIGQLPDQLREVVVLRELEELSYKEISEVIKTPIGTVMSRLWRARRRLIEGSLGLPEPC